MDIREISLENVFDICELTTNKDGVGTTMEEFLCCNATSIAESKYDPAMHPKAIYHEDRPVGFFMYRQTAAQPETATICRFMLDYRYQGRGLGRKAFAALLQYLRGSGFSTVVLMIDKENLIAKNLYLSFGFAFTGEVYKGEYYYQLSL